MHFLEEKHIFLFLVQVLIILSLTRFFGEIFRKFKQPALTAELLVGIILGPTIIGKLFPEFSAIIFPVDIIQRNMLETISWLGVLFLLLETGFEIDFSIAWRQRGSALKIALTDIVIPMIIAFIPCYFLPDIYLVNPDTRIIFAFFMAVVMTISAMPVAARVMHDLNLLKTDIGFLTMSALAVNDIIGWVLFTIIIGIFTQTGFDPYSTIFILTTTIIFAVFALTLGRYFSNAILNLFNKYKLPEPSSSFTFACLLGLSFGAFTQKLGIHALFGFFIAGIVIGEAKNFKQETRNIISQMVHALFVPIFFANIGLKIDFIADFDIIPVAIITVIGISGRFLGAWIGVSITNVPKINRTIISIAHTPGGMMEIVVALLAFESGIITPKIFIAIVFSAVISSIITGPWMRRAFSRRKKVPVYQMLNEDTIIPQLHSTSVNDAIREMTAVQQGKMKEDLIDRIVIEAVRREEDWTTAIGVGVAIPHVRLKEIFVPTVIFAKSQNGIDWNSPDGKPVHYIYLLITPSDSNDIHVELLSQIAKAMNSVDNRNVLDTCRNTTDLKQAFQTILGR